MLVIAVAAVTAIFLTTPAGQRMASGLGIDALVKDGPPKDDREFMLRVCDGDRAELKRRLDAERSRNLDMSEAQVYRRAIRTYMNAKETSDA
jgi:hypothetical protein